MNLGRFEGRWFDAEGNLIVAVYNRETPQLDLRLPKWLSLVGARLQGGQIRFYVRSSPLEETVSGSLKIIDENQISMAQVIPPDAEKFLICGNAFIIDGAVLVREPSFLWFAKLAGSKATRAATETYKTVHEGIFDRLSRIL